MNLTYTQTTSQYFRFLKQVNAFLLSRKFHSDAGSSGILSKNWEEGTKLPHGLSGLSNYSSSRCQEVLRDIRRARNLFYSESGYETWRTRHGNLSKEGRRSQQQHNPTISHESYHRNCKTGTKSHIPIKGILPLHELDIWQRVMV